MVCALCVVDRDGVIESPGRVPWDEHPVREGARSVLSDHGVVLGRRSASLVDEDAYALSKESGYGSIDEAFGACHDDGVEPCVAGGVHVFHQVFRRDLIDRICVFRVQASFDGDSGLPVALSSWRLAKEVTRDDYVFQVLMGASVSPSSGTV